MGFVNFYKDNTTFVNSILDRSITEFVNNKITQLGPYALCGCSITTLKSKTLKKTNNYSCMQCKNLKNVALPVLTTAGYGCFKLCTALETFTGQSLSSILAECFIDCENLTTVVLPNNSVVGLASINVFTRTPIADGTGYIYVPEALIDDYKTATNWVTYAEQFRTIEDYPEVLGVNGND